MTAGVKVLGGGLAACCAALLFFRSGFEVFLERDNRSRPSSLLLSGQTQMLLRDIFRESELFADSPRIRKRVICWGDGAAPVEVPHSGVVVSEQEMLETLWNRVISSAPEHAPAQRRNGMWTLISTQNSDLPQAPRGFGSRMASTLSVKLNRKTAEDCCWVESVPDGWLFLLPDGDRRATLISAGCDPESALEQSSLITAQVSDLNCAKSSCHVPAFPQILAELCGPGWLACGSAAMTFDPLCGEGAGHAAREALLAFAVIRATQRGLPVDGLLAHYSARLLHGFLRHLKVCLHFYESGGMSSFWRDEATALRLGIAALQEQIKGREPFRYRLSGYELESVAAT